MDGKWTVLIISDSVLIIGISIISMIVFASAEDFKYKHVEQNKLSNWTFKDYIEKFNPSRIWAEIETKNRRKGVNRTIEQEFNAIYNGIDTTDELLKLKVKDGNPKVLLLKDGRRWKPEIQVDRKNKYNAFLLKERFYELMKQAIYQARNKMVIMQLMRKKYHEESLYKMGFLMSKADIACKTFARFAYKAFKACSNVRQRMMGYLYFIDILETQERLLGLWFDIELLIDLIILNDENCKRMMNQVMTNRKNAWKFVD